VLDADVVRVMQHDLPNRRRAQRGARHLIQHTDVNDGTPLRIDLPPVRDSSGRHRNSARRRPNGRAHSGSPPRYRTSARVSTKMFPATRASRRAGAASGCCERRVARREPPADFLLDRIQGSDALDRSGRRRRHKIHCDTTFSPRFQPKISVSFTTFEVLTQPPKTC
jgi:hypothetical protein